MNQIICYGLFNLELFGISDSLFLQQKFEIPTRVIDFLAS